MKRKQSRLAIVGVLALMVTLTVGLMSGAVADAKKKKKKGKTGNVTVSKTTPTAIPPGVAPTASSAGQLGFAAVPLTVGKKAKGKVVGWDSVTLTTTFTGNSPPALSNVFMELTAPNGRTAGTDFETTLINPVSDAQSATTGNLVSGPLTETPDSPFKVCVFDPGPPPIPPCPNPEQTVGPPSYAGTVGSNGLAIFNGVPARGTWTLKLFNNNNGAITSATLNSVFLGISLKNAPQ
jgi:hypothetical protein